VDCTLDDLLGEVGFDLDAVLDKADVDFKVCDV
jgi:hypothetical protein